MAQIYKYTIDDINNIISNGFECKIDENIIDIISDLTSEVGSPTYIKTPNFEKQTVENNEYKKNNYKKNTNNDQRRKNKNVEAVKDDDWETIRTFSATKIEQHEGIDVFIDDIRSNLNKMSDKTYNEININIVSILNTLISENISNDEMNKISNVIFEIVSSNRFYSKLYANLYSNLLEKYDFIKNVFEEKLNNFMDVLNSIQFVSPEENYDLFCKINNDNEKRKALTAFYINLVLHKYINISIIENIILDILKKINILMKENDKKFIVDELVELLFILYNKELFDNELLNKNNENNEKILNSIKELANIKVKTYPSLTSKSIFKLMDIIEM